MTANPDAVIIAGSVHRPHCRRRPCASVAARARSTRPMVWPTPTSCACAAGTAKAPSCPLAPSWWPANWMPSIPIRKVAMDYIDKYEKGLWCGQFLHLLVATPEDAWSVAGKGHSRSTKTAQPDLNSSVPLARCIEKSRTGRNFVWHRQHVPLLPTLALFPACPRRWSFDSDGAGRPELPGATHCWPWPWRYFPLHGSSHSPGEFVAFGATMAALQGGRFPSGHLALAGAWDWSPAGRDAGRLHAPARTAQRGRLHRSSSCPEFAAALAAHTMGC